MTLSVSELFTPKSDTTYFDDLLADAAAQGLPITAWQPGSAYLILMLIVASRLSVIDTALSTFLQGGFLDWAASVTPEYGTDTGKADGTYTGGWLDALAQYLYNVTRSPATYAAVTITCTNTGAAEGPFAPGTLHFQSTGAGNPTYHNTATVTLATGSTDVACEADLAGATGGNAAPGAITTLVNVILNVTCTNSGAAIGYDPQTNAQLVSACRLKLQALSPSGAPGAYSYFATNCDKIDAATGANVFLPAGAALTGGHITRAKITADPATGIVTTYVANASGPPAGAALGAISGATNANPIEITVSSGHNCATGDSVIVSGVEGNVAANGTWTATVVDPTHLSLDGSDGTLSGSYVAGSGTAECGDVGMADYVIQSNCVPQAITATTLPAPAHAVSCTVDLWVAGADMAAVVAAVVVAVNDYFASLPIGGMVYDTGVGGVVPFDGVVNAIYRGAATVKPSTTSSTATNTDTAAASNPLVRMVLTLGDSSVDVPIASNEVPTTTFASGNIVQHPL